MANQIEVLKQTELCGQQFEVYGTPQEPLFVATDVAKMIEHTQPSKLVQMVEEDEKLIGTIFLSGQNREVWMLTEYGLYEVLMQSRKPIAKMFKRGVKQLLKQIRLGAWDTTTVQQEPTPLRLPRAARYDGFLEWQAQVKRYLRPEDKRTLSELYGCSMSHLYHVLAGSVVSMPLSRLISEFAEENCKNGIRAEVRPIDYQTMLFTDVELQMC